MPDLWPESPKPLWHKILKWAALAFGLCLWGAGVAAMYGDDYKLAVGLYFFGITLITADFLLLEDVRTLRGWKKVVLLLASPSIATILFALSVA